MVKLRLLSDPDIGLENNEGMNDVASLRQALGLIERAAGATPNPEAMTTDVIKAAFEIVTSMQNGLEEARISADGVSILATDALHDDEQLGAVFIQLARGIADHCKELGERRSELFRLLHPNRDHFEKEGVAGGGAAMSAAKLFRNWLALREAEHCRGQDDEEVERLTDEMIAIERAILAADPATAEDEQAQVAILAYYAVHEA